MLSNHANPTGRGYKLTEAQEDELLDTYETSRTPVQKFADQYGVTRQTIYNAMARARTRRDAAGSRQHGGADSGIAPGSHSTGVSS